jgi:acetyl-CoA carboxylase biotin carboxyl carrier protein
MDIKEIQNLIKFVARSGATEVNLETEDFKIIIKTTAEVANMDYPVVQHVAQVVPAQMPAPQAAAVAPPEVAPIAAEDDSKYVIIKSPMIGTMYRRPSPDKDLFVQVGTEIHKGDTVCIIEAMKLFNEIESEVSGKIVKVLVDDQSPVEYDQPLFVVDPA